jgi:hypothetical protein
MPVVELPMASAPAHRQLRELDFEDERIWTRDWVCVGIEQQIPAPGDLLPATVGHHGLHVQRRPDGGLRAAFNALQYGSCWTIPAQCGHGHKTKCPYVSCAHSRDTDALLAERGTPTREMRQFIGFNPLKLVDVALESLGPLIFVTLGDPPPLREQLGAVGSDEALDAFDGLEHVARFWVELDCNWKLASDALFESLGAPAGSGRLEERSQAGEARLYRAFPNVAVALLPNHAATLVVKPMRLDGVSVVVSLFAHQPSDAAGEDAVSALVAGWQAIALDARSRSTRVGPSSASPILAAARERLDMAANPG